MKRYRQILTALLLTLALCLTVLPAGAAEAAGSLDNFVTVRSYDGRFSDLEPWFYDNVVKLYELGLTEGSGEGRFGSGDETTVAQVLVFAARIHNIYTTGSAAELQARDEAYGDWYSASVDYLIGLGALSPDNPYVGRYQKTAATRSFVAEILAGLLSPADYEDVNGEVVDAGWQSGLYIQDVSADAPYAQAVLTLYRAGVLAGYGDNGAFMPDAAIVRRELTAMLTRLVDPSLRVTITDWQVDGDSVEPAPPEDEEGSESSENPETPEDPDAADAAARLPGASAAGLTMPELISWPTVFQREHALDDTAAIKGNLEYMLQRGELSLTVRIPGRLSSRQQNQLMEAYQNCMREYFLEQACAMYVSCSCSVWGGYTEAKLTFGSYSRGSSLPEAQNQQIRTQTMDYAVAVHDELWESGTLTADMTQQEIAQVYYGWIANHCRYDNDGLRRGETECHTALKLFQKGMAVCDGYTMAYNLLLEIEGINCDTACTEDHIWTVATLDGTTWHIDTTWGDQNGRVDYEYFCMTEWEAYHRSGL